MTPASAEIFYDSSGHLETVGMRPTALSFRVPATSEFPVYDPYFMTAILDEKWKVLVRNEYKDRSRVSEQRLADGQIIRYDYIFDPKHNIMATIRHMPNGEKKKFFFKQGIPARNE